MTDNKQYPPLPAPDTHCFDEDTGKDVWSYSADQMRAYVDADRAMRAASQDAEDEKFHLGQRVRKVKGSRWQGRIVGTYRTKMTAEGYAVESETEVGSVQIYPASALELFDSDTARAKQEGE